MSESDSRGRNERESDDDIKAALAAAIDAETSPVATAAEVADSLSIDRDATRKRLNRLSDRTEVGSRRVGRGRCYWLLPDERQARLSEVADDGHQEERDDVDEPAPADDVEHVDEDEAAAELLAVVDEIESIPGQSDAKQGRRREAVKATLRYAIEHGTVTRSEAMEHVYPEHTAYYTTGDDPAYSWWNNCVYKALLEVADRTDRLPVADTSGKWIPDLS